MSNISSILIVDDQPIGREVLEELLFLPEYELHFAENGLEALKLAAQISPDIILLDVMMPGMGGYEVCKQLRADPHLCEVPVLMLTALDDPSSRLEGIESGADDFISKPFNRSELRARVKTITRLARYRKLHEKQANLEKAHNQLLASYDATIEGWSRAMSLRDTETEQHTKRVTELSERLARMAGMSSEALLHVRWGALLHDIGKLGVPDCILRKPGELTAEEWVEMRKHPQYALEMLAPIEYLTPALDIPYCHHERWNGSGYPRGLKGEEIPLAARIFAVVDVWDALTSDRPYRAALPEETAMKYIQENSGTHFDPQIVRLFVSLMEKESAHLMMEVN